MTRNSKTSLRLALVATLTLVFASLARPARADDAADAKKFYETGTKYYNLGEFAKAIDAYKKAYELKPDPVLLYNIAQAFRLANDFQQALFFYRSFLRNAANTPNRAEVESRIKAMEEAIAKQKETQTAPPTGPVDPSTTPDTTPDKTPDETPDERTKIPSPDEAAATTDEPTTTDLPSTDTGGGSKPIYKKWWFWAGVGAVAIGTVAIVAASSGGTEAPEPPDSHFGSMKVF